MKKMDLCGVCAAKFRETATIKKVAGSTDNKVTCAECGRRRYGATYEVEKKR